MTNSDEITCVGCGEPESEGRLDRCFVCFKPFCTDCTYKAFGGRKFCSATCAHAFFFQGDDDDDNEDIRSVDE